MLRHIVMLIAGCTAACVTGPRSVASTGANDESVQVEAEPAQRINRAIELLEQGQPVYYTQISGGGYEEGKQLAMTRADYITYEMEHGPLDFRALRDFMQGLVDAGPTRTGHRTPAVVVTLPMQGSDGPSMRANAWLVQQALAAGVHGILLCNAESVDAVRIFVEASRYPFAPQTAGLAQGFRGNGSQGFASTIWGVSASEYMRVADVWPLNEDGELMLGIKIENPRATANVDALVRIPGLAFAEWGPGDQGFYLVGRPSPGIDSTAQPQMTETRARILQAALNAGLRFLHSCNEQNVIERLDEGIMICTGGDTAAADIGREYTGRATPW